MPGGKYNQDYGKIYGEKKVRRRKEGGVVWVLMFGGYGSQARLTNQTGG